MLRLGEEKTDLSVVSDQYGCPTYAEDLAGALLGVCECYEDDVARNMHWGVYHYSGDSSCSWYEFTDYIFLEAFKCGYKGMITKLHSIDTDEYPTLAKRPKSTIHNCDKFRRAEFGVGLSSWKVGVKKLLKEFYC